MRRVAVLVIAVLITIGLAASPAAAQEKIRKDKKGDAPAHVDIRSVRVQNNSKNFAVSVTLTKVVRPHTSVQAAIYPKKATGRVYAATSIPVAKKKYKTVLYSFTPNGDDDTRIKCEGLKTTWKQGRMGKARIVVPQRCLGKDAGTARTMIYAFDKHDEVDDSFDDLRSLITTRRR